MNKLKVYLDTNMVHDFFVNQAKYLKEKGELRIPRKFEFIVERREGLDFITSFLTKAEIVRELVSAHGMSYEEINAVWNDFILTSRCSYIERFEFDDSLVEIVSKIKMRLRTMFNLLHIFIAIDRDACFVSGDKDILLKLRENEIYTNAMTYVELREFSARGDG